MPDAACDGSVVGRTTGVVFRYKFSSFLYSSSVPSSQCLHDLESQVSSKYQSCMRLTYPDYTSTMTISPSSSSQPKMPLDTPDRVEDSTLVEHPRTRDLPTRDEATMPEQGRVSSTERNSDERRMAILTRRIMAMDKAEREMQAVLRTLRDTNASLDRTMARFSGSLDRLERKFNLLARRKADEVEIAKGKR